MIFQVFISRVFLISLDACFLPLSLHFMNAGSRLTEKHCYQISWCFNYVCRVVILQLFSLPDTTVVFTNKFCFPLFPQRQGRAVLPPSPPDTTKELKLHASHKNSDKVRPFGFLRWHMLLWVDWKWTFYFHCFNHRICANVRQFGARHPMFYWWKVCSFHWATAVNQYSS